MFEILQKYQHIAWDLDGVLLDDIRSFHFHTYILEHPEQTHSVVTFRYREDRSLVDNMFDEYRSGLSLFRFENERYLPVPKINKHRALLSQEEIDEQREWKGLQCREIGAEVLIDDMAELVERGCKRYGIAYFHPRDL